MKGVKRSITYREITVAIGILVAMAIALSLWLGVPGTDISGAEFRSGYDLPSAGKTFVLNITTEIFGQNPL